MFMTPEQTAQILAARQAPTSPTLRPTVPALEDVLLTPTRCLDKGFVRVIDYMGNDASVVQMARTSYGEGTKAVNDDRNLLRYLMRHAHTSPFEGCEIKLHMKLPIFVARQVIRHRTASLNEYSARYSVLRDEFYLPEPEQICLQSTDNKQGRGDSLPLEKAHEFLQVAAHLSDEAYQAYEKTLADGVARELARTVLPINIYTEWYWKCDLHNLLHFLRLRMHSHAQYEVRVYANAIADFVKLWVPETYAAFEEYRLHSIQLSRTARNTLHEILAENDLYEMLEARLADNGLGKRERKEIIDALLFAS
ncbi:FAD-dependent thymidylate synthase [Chitinibacter tainanensis]|uniref:FAD-dependent thymidylate synthase n=1 Tax=Chitinibacter tainanensis TaxID=230667 RepID=UPI000A008307|nr:FAD-dependent thymidylate synthase [Chitinibacter tainanensis]